VVRFSQQSGATSRTGLGDQQRSRSDRFYASTPAYRPVLQLHGWEDLAAELTALTKQNRWASSAV